MKIGGRGYSSHLRRENGGWERGWMGEFLEDGCGFGVLIRVENGICCLTRKRDWVAEHLGSIRGA